MADVPKMPIEHVFAGQCGVCRVKMSKFRQPGSPEPRLRHPVGKVGRIFIAPKLVLRENLGAFMVARNAAPRAPLFG